MNDQKTSPHPGTTLMRWLQFVGAGFMVFGVASGAAAIPALAGFATFYTDAVFWPLDGVPGELDAAMRALWAVIGGLTVALGQLIYSGSGYLNTAYAPLARTLIVRTATTWFVFDSLGSVLAGIPMNAVLNTVFFAMVAVPLWSSRKVVHASAP